MRFLIIVLICGLTFNLVMSEEDQGIKNELEVKKVDYVNIIPNNNNIENLIFK